MTTKRTPAEKAALSAFINAATSDADPAYPHGAAFIPWNDTPKTSRVLWRYLHEGRPAVIVGIENFNMLIEPIQAGRFARLRHRFLGRISVEISYRHRGAPTLAPIRAEIDRHVLQRREPQRPEIALPQQ
jgi:hypothetical protein